MSAAVPATPAAWGLLFLASVLLGLAAARLSARAPSLLQRVLGCLVWTAVLVVVYSEILSLVRQLHWWGALALSAAGALAARRWMPAAGVTLRDQIRAARAAVPSGDALWLLAFTAPIVVWGLFSGWLVLVSAEPLGDNMTYHLPRLAYWLQHRTLESFPSNDPRISTFPVAGNLLQLWPVLFLQRERLSAFVQLASHLGTALAVYAVARRLGGRRPGAAAVALSWLTIPAALFQAATSNVDLVASFFAVAACAFALGCLRDGTVWTAWTCVASAALAVGTKAQTLPLAVACSLAALVTLRTTRRPAFHLLPLCLLATVLAAMQPLRNAHAVGSPSGLPAVRWVTLSPGPATLAKNVELCLLPLMGGVGLAHQFPRWTTAQAVFEHGLGAPWLLVVAGALVVAFVRCVRLRLLPPAPAAYASLAFGYGIVILFAMRHQPSVDRFFLPVAAVLTPLAAALFVGRIRLLALSVVWLLGCGALIHGAQIELDRRAPRHAGRFLRYSDVAGADWEGLARASERLALQGPGRRVGIVTGQSMMQRLLLASRFQNVLVPLSHDPPLDRAALERLRLDAFFVEAGDTLDLQLFRQPWSPPPSRREGWRMSVRDGFDEDFLVAYQAAVAYPRFERTALLLGGPGSGWALDPTVRCNALYFVRRPTARRAALGIVHASSPYEIDEKGDQRLFWLGSRETFLKVFAGDSGSPMLVVRFLNQPPPGARVEVRLAGRQANDVPVTGSAVAVPLALRASIDFMSVRLKGASSPAPARLELAWDDPAASHRSAADAPRPDR